MQGEKQKFTLPVQFRLTALTKTPIRSGNWCVSMASMAVKEHKPAVNRIKNGSSFFG